jgi:hypothetical protein
MSVTEYERNHLFAWFEEHMGKERAATMMNLLPPVGWGDVATKRDLDVLADRLDTKIDAVAERLDSKIDAVAARLDSKIDGIAERLDSKIDGVAGRLDTRMDGLEVRIDLVGARTDARIDESTAVVRADVAELRSDLQRTFATWMFAAQGAVVAAIGLLLVVVR